MLIILSILFWGLTESAALASVLSSAIIRRYVLRLELFSRDAVIICLRGLLDLKAFIFIIFVGGIRARVLKFSWGYIAEEKHFNRFHLLVVAFISSIYILIISTDIPALIIGWDGLGVSSFFLVVYFQDNTSWNAGILTLLRNRLGDIAIIIRASLLVIEGHLRHSLISLERGLALCLIFAAFTKSAQIPFSAWLPAAIAAPTPVSALVHSSTLVTAGVYLLVRIESRANRRILRIGIATIIIAGATALYEVDRKKVVALSTLRQLGLIIACLGVGAWRIAYFHILTHAAFKSLLFVRQGRIIHRSGGFQDLRIYPLVARGIPITSISATIRGIRLCGIPFIRGFYSKDAFLEAIICIEINPALIWLAFLGILLTFLYTLRIVFTYFLWAGRNRPLNWTREGDAIFMRAARGQLLLTICGGASVIWVFAYDISYFYLTFLIKNIILILLIGSLCYISFRVRTQKYGVRLFRNLWVLPLVIVKNPLGRKLRDLSTAHLRANESYLFAFYTYRWLELFRMSRVERVEHVKTLSYSILVTAVWLLALKWA